MVTADSICRDIAQGLSKGFSCRPAGNYVEVRTPFIYPDGQLIDLYVREQGDVFTVTDLGETMRWLESHSWSDRRTIQQDQVVQQVCVTLGIDQFSGMLQARVTNAGGIAEVIARAAQAAARVADLWFTFRAKTGSAVRDEVEEFLRARKIPFERAIQRTGSSGKQWGLDFETRTAKQSSLIQVLTTESRAAASRLTEHTVASWVDLRNLRLSIEKPEFVSLFDDTIDVWRKEDFLQLEAWSTVAYWSDPDGFARQLAA